MVNEDDLSSEKKPEEIKTAARQILEMETDVHSEVKIDAPQFFEIKTDVKPVAKTNPHRNNPYYKLLLALLREFVVVDYQLEILDKNEPTKKIIKTSSCFKLLDQIAQREIIYIQNANANLTKYRDPITQYNVHRFLDEPVDVPSLVDIAAYEYRYIINPNPKDIKSNEEIPQDIREHLLELELSPPNIYLEGQKYILRGSEAFSQINLSQTGLHHYLELLVRSTVAADKSIIFDLWKGESKAPIHLAAAFGNADIIQDLINAGADRKELSDVAARRPIHYAVVFKNFKTLLELIKQEVELNPCSSRCPPPIYLAVELGYTGIVAELLGVSQKEEKNQIDINAVDNDYGTLLFYACNVGKDECVKWLLEHGADVTIPNNLRQRPIHVACFNNHIKVVKTLVKKFPKEVNALDGHNETPLHYAVHRGFSKLAEFLTRHGAKVVAFSDEMETPLSYANNLESKDQRHDTRGVLKKADRRSVNIETSARNRSIDTEIITNIFLPGIVYLLLTIGVLIGTGFLLPELDIIIRFIISIGLPVIPALGVRKLANTHCVEPLERYFLRRAERLANRSENRVEVVNDIENNLNNAEELSTHAKVIPSLNKETKVVNTETDHHNFDLKVLNLDVEERMENSSSEEEQENFEMKQSKEEESEEESVLSKAVISITFPKPEEEELGEETVLSEVVVANTYGN